MTSLPDTTSSDPPLGAAAPSARLAEILEAACRVIARDGAHGLHMSAVAGEAGVSKALVHYYVSTRQELLRLAMAYADAKTRAAVEEDLARLPDGRARLEHVLVAYATNAAVFSEGHALWNMTWESLKLDHELAPEVRAGYRRWFEWIADLVDEGKADGSIPASRGTRNSAISLNALVEGLASLVDTEVVKPAEAEALTRAAVADLVTGPAA